MFETTLKPSHKSQKMPEVLLLYSERNIQFSSLRNVQLKKNLSGKMILIMATIKKEGNIRPSGKRREQILTNKDTSLQRAGWGHWV